MGVCTVQLTDAQLRQLQSRVQKPGRYAGREWNSVTKDWSRARATLVLAYPDLYEIGMSNLGLALLYDRVNQRPDLLAERVYAPWPDMEAALRAAGLPLYSLESRHALNAFDVIGFSLQHELNYTNMLAMLELGRVPVLASERSATDPLVIAGGSCTYNPAPLADFVDVFAIGEGEEVLIELLDAVAEWKTDRMADGRQALLLRLAQIPGLYVPALYATRYQADGTIATIAPSLPGVPAQVRKRIVARLGPMPARPIVPTMQIVHDRASVEIQRGCSRGCRFCQAGMIYRPIRQRSVDETLRAIDEALAATGYNEVALVSLSSSDHPGIEEIVARAMAEHAEQGISVSLPSLRIDSFSVRLAEMIQSTRKTGFTFAPEAGSQRLRDVVNKGVCEEDLLRTAEAVFQSGWNRLKLYFMLGLPTETDDDVLEIARLVREIRSVGRAIRGRRVEVSVSVGTFVPKPFTPFQWEPLAERGDIEHRQQLLRGRAQMDGVKLSWPDWDSTWLEAVLSRGDARLGRVIARVWGAGARFEAWSESYRPTLWHEALAQLGVDADWYTRRPRDPAEVLPWDVLDVGVTRTFLLRERDRALRGELSPDCSGECHACGVRGAYAAERQAVDPADWRCPA
jgi:radical SAM family uncharacterized protein